MAEPLTEKLLEELLAAPSPDAFLDGHEPDDRTLSSYLQELLEEKHLQQARVVRMADLNTVYGYELFVGDKTHPGRDIVLQIAFAMALSLRETNRALRLAKVSELCCKDRRDAIIIFCLDRGCSLQKVNEELYRFGEPTIGELDKRTRRSRA